MKALIIVLAVLLIYMASSKAKLTITGSQEYGIPGQPYNLTCTLTTGKTSSVTFIRTGAASFEKVQVSGGKCYNAAIVAVCNPSECSCINDGAGKGSQFSWIITPDSSMHLSTWICKDFEKNESEELTLRVAALVTSVTLQNPPAAGSDLSLNKGTSTNLVCVTSACRPSAAVQWYIGDTNYTSSSQKVTDVTGNLHITTSTLTFTPNRNMNKKTLKCSAYNYGDTANTVRYKTQLNVKYPPENKAALNVSSVSITEGQSVSILCEIKGGNPKARIAWDCFSGSASDVSTAADSRSVITIVGESSQDGQPCTCRGQHDLVSISSAEVTFTVGFAPKAMTLSPSGSQTVVEGQDIQPVTCSAKCNPQCTYSWSFKGSPTISGATLRLNGIRRNQEGVYTCTARNDYGSKSADVTNLVYYGPGNSVTLDPSQEAYTKNENDILPSITCAADCSPNCSYVWMLPNNKNTTRQILSLSTLKREEQGTYGCVARNIVGESVKTVTISVQYGPADSITLDPSREAYTKNENDILPSITCGADCRPDCTYVWMLPSNKNNTGPVLSLSTLKRDEQGSYKCVTRNIVGESVKTITVTVRYGPGNSISFNPPSSTITEVENTTLTPVNCSADCRPQCKTRWTSGSGNGNFPNPLSLGKLKRNESGQYTCTATNVVSSDTKLLIVHVKYSPIISSLSYVTDGPNVSENSAIQVQCKIDSYPRSTIKWTYESGQSLQTDTSSLTSTLTLNQANCFDTGYYKCSASNELGSSAAQSLLINVLCEPRLYKNSTDLIGIGSNDNLIASVKFVANPSPEFTWMFRKNVSQNFTKLHNNSNNFLVFNHRKHVLYTSQATRNNMREEDFGFYTIQAVNGIGRNASFTVQVVPKRAPDPPAGVKAECVHYNTARVTWISKFDGGKRQHFRIGVKTSKEIHFTKGGRYEDAGKDKSITGIVNDLKEKTLYFLTVFAINDFGSSQLSHVLDCRTPTNENIKTCMEQKTTENVPNTASVALYSVSALLIISATTLIGVYLYKRRRYNKRHRPSNEEGANDGKIRGSWTNAGQRLDSTQTYEELGAIEQRIDNQYKELKQTSTTTETLSAGVYDALGRREPPHQYEHIKPKQRKKGPVYENTLIK